MKPITSMRVDNMHSKYSSCNNNITTFPLFEHGVATTQEICQEKHLKVEHCYLYLVYEVSNKFCIRFVRWTIAPLFCI